MAQGVPNEHMVDAPPIAVFLHVATMGHYQAVLDEMLYALRDTGLAALCAWIEVGVVGTGTVELPDIGTRVRIGRHSADVADFEHPTLSALRRYCIAHPTARLLYLNCLGGRHIGVEWQIRVEWRKLLRHVLMVRRDLCLDALRRHDLCAVQWVTAPMPHATSNNWWANASHIASLPDPAEAAARTIATDLSAYGGRWIDAEIKRRHSGEFWLGMQPTVRPFSLLDLARTRLPPSELGSVPWWQIPGIDWERVARRQLGERRFDRFDLAILALALRLRASARIAALKRRLRRGEPAAAASTGHRH
jgi:hypothetical protein